MKEIPLTQGMFAQVDDEWYNYLTQWKWYYHKNARDNTGYATRCVGKRHHRKIIRMHRLIMNAPDGLEVNHIDFDGCNNQRSNLENVTNKENSQHRSMHKNNTSGYIGVNKKGNRWQTEIRANCQRYCLGTFGTPEEAARVYDAAAIQYFGKRAVLNFPSEN